MKAAGEIYTTTKAVELISTEKLMATINAGSLWTKVSEDGRDIGAVIQGEGEYAVDAIVETRHGAAGRSFKGPLTGFKLYLGKTDLVASSRNAGTEEVKSQGHSQQEFVESAQRFLESQGRMTRYNAGRISPIPGQGFLLWVGQNGKSNVLFADGQEIGFVDDGDIYVTHGKKTVFIRDGSVMVADRFGFQVHIDKGRMVEPRIVPHFERVVSRRPHHSFYCC